jgi:hypothetical protein
MSLPQIVTFPKSSHPAIQPISSIAQQCPRAIRPQRQHVLCSTVRQSHWECRITGTKRSFLSERKLRQTGAPMARFGQKRNFPVFLGRSRLQHLLPFTTGNLYNTDRLSGGRTTRPPTNYNQPAHCALPSLRPFMHAETRRSSNRYRINDDILIQMRINFVNQWPSGTALHFPHPFASRNDFLIRCLWQPVCYPNGGPGACAVEEAVT